MKQRQKKADEDIINRKTDREMGGGTKIQDKYPQSRDTITNYLLKHF